MCACNEKNKVLGFNFQVRYEERGKIKRVFIKGKESDSEAKCTKFPLADLVAMAGAIYRTGLSSLTN